MRHFILIASCTLLITGNASCQSTPQRRNIKHIAETVQTPVQQVTLPAPYATESATHFSKVIGWPEGKMPTAPAGFVVKKFAADLDNPRWIYVGPNGDIFVAEATTDRHGFSKVAAVVSGASKAQDMGNSPDQIILLRDADGDGVAEMRETFLTTGLNQPFGMLIMNGQFYVGNTDGVVAFPYAAGQTKISGEGKKILDLPAGGYNNHWTRNLIASKDGKKILVTVGSGSNVAEHGIENEARRADVLEINPDGSGEQIYGSGLRNPVGAAFAPGTSTLWVAVNERDGLGDELVPDYMTSVKRGGFYGWPYSYWGQHPDPRLEDKQRPDLVKTAIVPDISLGAHTASLGLAFDERSVMPGVYKGGAFIGQHGSWNRSQFSGYKVVFVPFRNGKPAGEPQDFLTGFMANEDRREVYGRPVGVAFTQKGVMLVADDAGTTIWSVSPAK